MTGAELLVVIIMGVWLAMAMVGLLYLFDRWWFGS